MSMKKGFALIELMIVVAIIAVIISLFWGTGDSEHNRDLHKSWIKVNPQHKELTFDEWLKLKNNYLLPGQSSPNHNSTIVLPVTY